MDLSEQADKALDDLLDNHGRTFDSAERRIARMMWLDGYQRGMDATTAKVNEAFESWKVTS